MPFGVRYLVLLPNDPEKRARMKDLDGEHENLNEYRQWAKTMSVDSETPQDRVLFYQNLTRAIQRHWIAVSKEVDELWSLASDLAQFEFRLLDNKGGTSRIEKSLAEGEDIFRIWGDAAGEKYEYLIPSDFKPDPLKALEDEWLDFDGGTAILERELRAGVDVLACWPDLEVRRKYGDLVRLMPLLPKEDVQVTAAEKGSIASSADNREGAEEEIGTVRQQDRRFKCVPLLCQAQKISIVIAKVESDHLNITQHASLLPQVRSCSPDPLQTEYVT